MNEKLIRDALNHLNDDELLQVWNTIHDDESPYHIYKTEEINDLFNGQSPLEIVQSLHFSEFDPFENYFSLNEDEEYFTSSDSLLGVGFDKNKVLDYIQDFGLDEFPVLQRAIKERQKDASARLDELEKQIAELKEILG